MSTEQPRICVVGSTNVDLTFRTGRLPRPGETIAGAGFQLGGGGKGANQAVMAARLGARVAMVSRVGSDVFGEQALRSYQQEGIDTTHVVVDAARPTGTAAILVDDEARNCIVVVPGANGGLTPQDVRAAAPVIQGADLLLCQMEVPLVTTLEAFRLARAAGVRTVLNPAPAMPLPEELLRLTSLCVPNETEAEILTSQTVTGPAQAEAAARILAAWSVPAVIVTLGERGALLLEGDAVLHLPAVPVAALDPTGAGDAFIGSLAVFWAGGLSLRDAARRAGTVAALSVTRPGAQTAFPTAEEVDAFVQRQAASNH
jgi:ribokinase